MTHPTDEELDEMARDLCHTGELSMPYRCEISDAICALRAQLAEALETWPIWAVQIKDKLQRYGVDPGDEWNVAEQFEAWLDEAVSDETARADRAEAERAAQIEADARIAEDAWLDGVPVAEISAAIRAHSHDHTALDRMLAEAREQALREVAETTRGWRNDVPMTGEECANTILSLINKEN